MGDRWFEDLQLRQVGRLLAGGLFGGIHQGQMFDFAVKDRVEVLWAVRMSSICQCIQVLLAATGTCELCSPKSPQSTTRPRDGREDTEMYASVRKKSYRQRDGCAIDE